MRINLWSQCKKSRNKKIKNQENVKEHELSLDEISTEEVDDAIKSIKLDRAEEEDGLDPEIIKWMEEIWIFAKERKDYFSEIET